MKVVLLGAGFSRAISREMPLMSQLGPLVLEREIIPAPGSRLNRLFPTALRHGSCLAHGESLDVIQETVRPSHRQGARTGIG